MDILNYRKTELQKIMLKLGRDYYPVTETLCSNAHIQAAWLHENSEDVTTDQNTLFKDLYEEVKQYIDICTGVLRAPVDSFSVEKINACIAVLNDSRQKINALLKAISDRNIFQQNRKNEMLDNLCIKTTVINNILTEIFKIEQEEIVPLLQEQF